MAKFDRFLIAPSNTGLQTDLKPWLINDDAYSQLNNAYVFRGRVRKRFGSRFMGNGWTSLQTEPLFSRLRVNVGTTAAVSGNFGPAVIPPATAGAIYKIGQQFSIGTTVFTVVVANGAMLTTGAATGTFNTGTGTLTIVGNTENPLTAIWWYPSEPVMGFTNYGIDPINDQPSYAWDTRFSYVFQGGFWQRLDNGGAGIPVWHGSNINFFWSTNWQGITTNPQIMFTTNFFVTNYNGAGAATDDPIWYYNGTTWTAASGANGFYFLPAGGAARTGPFVRTSRLIVLFKNRLVLLNTVENDNSGGAGVNTNFTNRARFCHLGSPFSNNAWYEPNQVDAAGAVGDGGGYVDAATEEEIISCEFIKDRLIVYFERSTWELAYTGNQVQPFTWQKINTELGSESQMSTVPFDKEVLTMGNTGVHSCNGANVQRIDNKIPQEIFQISNKNIGVQRVAGIRDYFVEMVYWTFPSDNENASDTYPNRVLVFNYQNGSWAFNNDCITAFGYFEQQQAMTWASTTTTWEEADFTWNSGTTQIQFRQVIAGNQQGYTFIIDSETSRNERAMQITNITYPSANIAQLVIIDHTLEVGDFITIENATGINLPIIGSYQVTQVLNANTVNIFAPDVSGTYLGGGNSARVSRIDIVSKQWNPYAQIDRNVFLQRIDFGVTKTQLGEITVDYSPSTAEISLIEDGGAAGTNALMGTSILETSPYPVALAPLEQMQERLWHPIYFQSDGTCIQIRMYLSDAQLSNLSTAWSFFELQGSVLYTMPTTYRMQ